jgi:hypothetical protein
MKRLLISETGGTLTRNFISSLREARDEYHIIGVTSHPYELALSNADESYLVPEASDPSFIPVLRAVAKETNAEFLHSQHDAVIKVLAANRDHLSVSTFLPPTETINLCVDKYASYAAWKEAGIPVAESVDLDAPADLEAAFKLLGKKIWIRFKEGGGGAGALPVSDVAFARAWIDHFDGWGRFMASELLSPDSVTWSSIWRDGKLVVAQTRKRLYWLFGNRTLSGVTGVTGAAVTVRDSAVDTLAERAVRAIDPEPNGIFSVDMTYDQHQELRATEINIGRFFTTIHFFTRAGLNMPEIFVKLAFGETPPEVSQPINPLEPGLVWIRGMDTPPALTTEAVIDGYRHDLEQLRKRVDEGT